MTPSYSTRPSGASSGTASGASATPTGMSIRPKTRSAEAFAFSYWSTMFETSASGVTNRWVRKRKTTKSPLESGRVKPSGGPNSSQ